VIIGHPPTELFLFVVGKLEAQAFENSLRNAVLDRKDILPVRVDAVAPQDLAAQHVEKLCCYAELVRSADKTGRQNGMNS
jgi:hypothetical protein